MSTAGINLIGVKAANRLLLLRLICTAGKITRSELSASSKLSPMTVTNIINELLKHDLVEESASDRSRSPGRTPMLLQVSPRSPVICGIFVTKSCLYGAVGDLSLNLFVQKSQPLDAYESEDTILEKLRSLADQMLEGITRPVLGLGIATAGVVDTERRSIRYISDFYHIGRLDISERLEQHFQFPVFVCNDMQAAGLSELYFGHGKSTDSFLYVGITNGIGASLVSHGKLLDCSGEMGHMSVNAMGERCPCGNRGCLELYASVPNLLRHITEETGQALWDMEQAVTYASNNKVAYTILHNAMWMLSHGINNYLNLMSVPLVILGHDAYYLSDELIDSIAAHVANVNVAMRSLTPPRFLRSTFGANAPLYGSLCIVIRQVFDGSYPLEQLYDSL